VNDVFELLDPDNAKSFLKHFSGEVRRKGESLFAKGVVEDLAAEEPGRAYLATVNDNGGYEVEVYYDGVDGWIGSCECPREPNCPHVFATMRALLAEHSAAVVRTLSSGQATAVAASSPSKAKPEQDAGLARRLLAAVGRPLTAEETKFIRKVQAAYKRVRQLNHISRWDFQEMGLSLGGYGWDTLQIWPALPVDEHEFWLYVARTARAFRVVIPEFMAPVTDFSRIEERVTRWERSREVEKWKQTLGNLRLENMTGTVTRGETDLRLVLAENEARLHWKRPGHEEFEPMKQTQIQQILDDERRGWVQFGNEAALMWQLISARFFYASSLQLRYFDDETLASIGRVIRAPLLESRIVNRDGQVLARPEEPLRWDLGLAESDEEDYRLRLVQADGTPPPPVYFVAPGTPPLYVTAKAIFSGPPPMDDVLDATRENRIPAPALERAEGVAFLQSLGLPMPPRVAQRIQRLPLQVAIHCELKPIYPDSRTEDCVVRVLAEASDGHQEQWTGDYWINPNSISPRRPRREEDQIIVYERSNLAEVERLLEPLELKSGTYHGGLAARVTKKFPEQFSAWLKSVPPHVTVHLAGELASLASADVAGQVRLDVSEAEIDWFDLRVVLNVSDTTLTPQEIKLLLNAKGNYVRLSGKGWRRLQFDLSEDENERLARLGLSTRELSAEPQRLHALQLADDAAKKFLPEQQVEEVQRRATEIKARVAPELPCGVTAHLRPYQLEGFHFLAYLSTNRFGGILADDMGLGKTLQTLAWLLWLREQRAGSRGVGAEKNGGGGKTVPPAPNGIQSSSPGLPPTLVVCPKSVMDNWHAEAARFTPSLRVKSWPANQLNGFREQLGSAEIHVINYNQLRLLGESLAPVRWLAVVLDEGQYIKNPSSQTAQVARALKAEHRLVLSGTPIENRLMDLWSLMAFAMPGILGSRAQFGKLYDAKGDPFARRRLSSRVRPFLLRRTKAQVATDLPDRIEEDLFCEIEGEQKTLYRAELKRAQQLLLRIKTQKELAQQQFHFLTSLLRLRQICCHPRLVQTNSSAASAKTEALLEQLEPLMDEGQKVLVFSQFVELLALLRPAIAERNWPTFYLAGETENRGELVQQFQSADGPAVFLISLKAGGFGLNLTAASYVVLFDPWWNPAVENQAIDRTHRIGQVNKVIAYRLLIKDSIEEKIRELQKQKKALAQDVLGEERFAQSLSLSDLQFLFAD
jgi:hypothetical protein